MPVLLSARRLCKSYATKTGCIPVLRHIDLDIHPGEFVTIIGKSGSGKSTLLYSLCGLLQIDAGNVMLCGETINGRSPSALARIRRDHVGFVFQDLNLISALDIADNVTISSRVAGIHTTREHVSAILRYVGLDGMEHAHTNDLSGGQRQRVAIARVLLRQPDLLFADEPTGSLDVDTAQSVMHLMRQTVTNRTALVMVTHDLDLAASADRVIVLAHGQAKATPEHASAAQLFALTQPQ